MLSEKNKIILAIAAHEDNGNLDFFNKHIDTISNLIVTITERLTKEKVQIKRHEDYYEIHYFKFVFQTLSLKHLFEGTPLKAIKPDHSLHDLSTIYNSTRSLIETSITINYLYYNHKSDEQAVFRYLLYIAGGLNNRQSYPATIKENIEKRDFEKEEIQKILTEIKSNTYFISLHPHKQNSILGRLHAFENGIDQRITESGLDSDLFHTMWRLLSNYSHSEYIEAMQLIEYLNNISSHIGRIFSAYRICFMLNCYQIIKMTERFDLAKTVFQEQSLETQTIIDFYNKLLLGIKLNVADNEVKAAE